VNHDNRYVTGTLIVLCLLPLLISAVALPFLPDTVVTHTTFFVGVDARGPKWRMLLVPGLFLTACNFILYGAFRYKYNRPNKGGKSFPLTTLVGFLCLFIVTTLLILTGVL